MGFNPALSPINPGFQLCMLTGFHKITVCMDQWNQNRIRISGCFGSLIPSLRDSKDTVSPVDQSLQKEKPNHRVRTYIELSHLQTIGSLRPLSRLIFWKYAGIFFRDNK